METGPGGPAPILTTRLAPGATPQSEAGSRQQNSLAVKLPLGIRLPDGSEESSVTENISESSLCFACDLELQVGDRLYVTVGLDPPKEQCDLPARIVWRRPAIGKGRAFYAAQLENGNVAKAPSSIHNVSCRWAKLESEVTTHT